MGPAEELESDRQQRVYRGQPSTIGQVASDRDAISTHSNAIPVFNYSYSLRKKNTQNSERNINVYKTFIYQFISKIKK